MLKAGYHLLRSLRPGKYVSSIYGIDTQALWDQGFRAILTDLDNTLTQWNAPAANPRLTSWLANLRERGFSVCILSNNVRRRVEPFAAQMGVPFISDAGKPRRKAFHEALATIGAAAGQTVMIGDQLFTDILGGNRMGMYTVLVRPLHAHEHAGTRLVRIVERWLLRGQAPLDEEGRRPE